MSLVSLYLDSSVWNYQFNDHVVNLQAQAHGRFRHIESGRSIEVFDSVSPPEVSND